MAGRYNFTTKTRIIDERLSRLENKHVTATWFERVGNRTGGTLTPPHNSEIVLDTWDEGIDAVTSEIGEDGKPTFVSPKDLDGKILTVTLDIDGNWKLSGTPRKFPIAIIYVYSIPVVSLRACKTLDVIDKGNK